MTLLIANADNALMQHGDLHYGGERNTTARFRVVFCEKVVLPQLLLPVHADVSVALIPEDIVLRVYNLLT